MTKRKNPPVLAFKVLDKDYKATHAIDFNWPATMETYSDIYPSEWVSCNPGKIKLCANGLHFCLADVDSVQAWYQSWLNLYLAQIYPGCIIHMRHADDNKFVVRRARLIRRIPIPHDDIAQCADLFTPKRIYSTDILRDVLEQKIDEIKRRYEKAGCVFVDDKYIKKHGFEYV
jgi:hypothetical protein